MIRIIPLAEGYVKMQLNGMAEELKGNEPAGTAESKITISY